MTADLTTCVQWLVFGLCWEQGWGLGLLDKPGVLETTQTELEGWLSSPQPLNSTGSEGLRDCVAEKGLIPCVGSVWVSYKSG